MIDPLATPPTLLLTAANPDEDIPVRINALGEAVDAATDQRDEEVLRRADSAADSLIASDPDSTAAAELAYLKANAWAALHYRRAPDNAWEWEGAETQSQILHPRKAAHHPAFGQLDPMRQCQIETRIRRL